LLVSYDSSNPGKTAKEIEKTSIIDDASTPKKIGNLSFGVVELEKGQNLQEASKKVAKISGVKNASPNYVRRASYTPSDEFYAVSSWPADALNLNNAWNQAETEGWLNNNITIGVLDTGIDTDHEDLKNNLWVNSGEIPANGIDDDGNGYIDDVNGVNFTAMANSGYSSDFIKWVNIVESETSYVIGGNAPDDYIPGVAQQVTGTGSQISKVSFYLGRAGKPNDLTIKVKSSLTGATLASASIKASDVPSYDWGYDDEGDISSSDYFEWDGIITATATLNTPVTLTNGQKYYLVFETASKNYKNKWGLFGSDHAKEDQYTGGDIWLKQANSWVSMKKSDICFFTDAHNGNVEDDEGHGSHVSGIIGAEHNSTGIAGVVPGARLMSVKVLDSDGIGSDAQIISGLKYATDNGAKVINMSLGSTENSSVLRDAVNAAYQNGVVVVAAAGNIFQGAGSEIDYPAAYDNVLSVAATNAYNNVASFSNYNRYVDVSAPGAYIYSTINDGTYDTYSGTSMASPYVAGVAALVRIKHPTWTPAQVYEALKNTATDLGAQTRDDYYGDGLVNANSAINAPDFSTITTSASPASSKVINYGNVIRVRALLKTGGWPPMTTMANQNLSFYYLTLNSKGAYVAKKLKTSATSSNGYTASVSMGKPKMSGFYRVYWGGNSTNQRAYKDLEVKIKPVIRLKTSSKVIKRGKKVKLSGTFTPRDVNSWQEFRLQRSGNRKSWKTLDWGEVSKYERGFSFTLKPSRSYYYRIYYSGDSGFLYSACSHAIKVSVKK
jgi:subtilisin family serine protease